MNIFLPRIARMGTDYYNEDENEDENLLKYFMFIVNAPASECNISLLNITQRAQQAKTTELLTKSRQNLNYLLGFFS